MLSAGWLPPTTTAEFWLLNPLYRAQGSVTMRLSPLSKVTKYLYSSNPAGNICPVRAVQKSPRGSEVSRSIGRPPAKSQSAVPSRFWNVPATRIDEICGSAPTGRNNLN